jgi:hypothetical protein
MQTINYNLPLISQNQSMKEISVNESINRIDYLLNRVVIDIVEVLPEDPFEGSLYIQSDNSLALFTNNKWDYFTPSKNIIFYVLSKKSFAVFDEKWVFSQ